MSQASSFRAFAMTFAIVVILAACGSESESPAESSQATTAQPSLAQPSTSPSAGASIDPAPAGVAGDPTEILLRMDITPDSVSPNPQGLGGAGWYAPGADFTLYRDGTIIFRDFAEDAGHPQNYGSHLVGHPLQTGHLTAEQVTEVLRFALDEGGLADARRRYSINVVDLYTLPEFELRSGDIEKRVTLHGGGVVAPDANIDQFATLSGYLSDIDEHLEVAVEAWTPDRYWGLLREVFPHEVSDSDPLPWPWPDIPPAGWLGGRRSLLPEDVAALGLQDISGGVCCIQLVGPDGSGTYSLEIAPAIPTPLRPDALAEVVTNDLVVRSLPGTGPDSEILSPSISAPRLVYVVDGPVAADGYDWYLVAPVFARLGGGDTPSPSGWLAAAGRDGEPWIAPTTHVPFFGSCPYPTLDGVIALDSGLTRLACFGDESLTLEGTLGSCGSGGGTCALLPPGSDPYALGTSSLAIRLLPGMVLDAQPGAQVRVEGHFDDPAAEGCASDPPPHGLEDFPEIVVVLCRGEFVATQVTIASD